MIRSRLCIAVAALAVQAREWTGVVPTFVTMLSNDAGFPALVDLLKAFPEEANNNRVRVDRRVRREFRDELDACASSVLKLVIEKLPSVGSDTAMMASLVEVATVWVRHCYIKPEDLVATGILATTFQALNFDALFEPAAALVVELLERYNSHTRHAVVVNALIPGLMALVPKFNAAKAREEEDVEREYVRMFSAMGVSYVSLILDEASSNQMPLVTLLVKCTDSPNSLLSSPDICKSMFQFWFHLVDTFNHIKSKTHKQACRAMLAPAFSELVGVLLRVVRFPDEFDSLPADKQQEFIVDFRLDVSDILKDCCTMLGVGAVLNTISTILQREVEVFLATNGAGRDGVGAWQTVEACLFALRSISRRVPMDEATIIPLVMRFIPSLPRDKTLMWKSAIELVGRYAGWLRAHEEPRTKVLAQLIPYLHVEALQAETATAINEVCQACAVELGEPVLAIQSYVAKLKKKAALAVMEGLCCVASELPYDRCVAAQQRLALPMVNTLQQFVVNPKAAAEAAAAAGGGADTMQAGVGAMCDALERLTVTVRYITPDLAAGQVHPSVATLQQVFEILKSVGVRFASQRRIVEKLTRLFKHAIHATKEQFAPMVQPLGGVVMAQYDACPHAGWLYVASTMMSRYGGMPEFAKYLVGMVIRMTNKTFGILRGGLPAFTANPDIVEDLFRMLSRGLEEVPQLLVPAGEMPLVLKCACVGLKVEHKEANYAVLSFLEAFFALGVSSHRGDDDRAARLAALIAPVLTPEGDKLVLAAMQGIMADLPQSCIDDPDGSISAVLWQLFRLAPTLFHTWMAAAMAAVIPESIITKAVQATFLTELMKSASEKKFAQLLYDLSDTGYSMRK